MSHDEDNPSEAEKEGRLLLKRIEILDEMEKVTDNYIKMANLLVAKGIETNQLVWFDRSEEMFKEYHFKCKDLTKKYVDLGGTIPI